MHSVLLGIGSNIDRKQNIQSGLQVLASILDEFVISPIYESHALGFEGDNFYNLVVHGETKQDLSQISSFIRDLEFLHGREQSAEKYSSRHLDIDILMFDRLVGTFDRITLPRPEILTSAHVLLPLSDIAPNLIHPTENKTFLSLLGESDFSQQSCWQIQEMRDD